VGYGPDAEERIGYLGHPGWALRAAKRSLRATIVRSSRCRPRGRHGRAPQVQAMTGLAVQHVDELVARLDDVSSSASCAPTDPERSRRSGDGGRCSMGRPLSEPTGDWGEARFRADLAASLGSCSSANSVDLLASCPKRPGWRLDAVPVPLSLLTRKWGLSTVNPS
jgi:hypothetical protein